LEETDNNNLNVEKYKELFKALPTPTYIWRKIKEDFILIDFNEAADKIVEGKMKDFLGIKASDLYKDNPRIVEELNKTINGENLEPKEMVYKYRSIEKINILKVRYIFSPPDLVFVHTDDITEQKQIEKELSESERKFRRIFDAIPDLFFLVSKEGIFLEYKGTPGLLYVPPEIFLGENIRDVLPEPTGKDFYDKIQETLQSKEPTTLEYSLSIENEILYFEGRILYFSEERAALFIRDISGQKKAKQALINSEEKYREAYNRAEFYKDLFAHDISNILQNVLSANQLMNLLIKEPLNHEKFRDLSKLIDDQVIRGRKLVFNIRKLSKLEEEEEIPHKPTKVRSVLENAINFLKDSFQDKRIDIHIESSGENLEVKANEFLLDVFENILINAAKYNQSDSIEITVKINRMTRQGSNFVKLEFLDNGIGIDDTRKTTIFHRATGIETAKGMGLGLSLVKKIIDTYDGDIWVEDRVIGDYSKGSNFIILIPEVEVD